MDDLKEEDERRRIEEKSTFNFSPKTDIMRKYTKNSVKYEVLHSGPNAKSLVCCATIDGIPKLVVKRVELKEDNKKGLDNLLREFHVGNNLSAISDNVIKTIDLKDIIIEEEGKKKIVVEILTEYGGRSLNMQRDEINKSESAKIIYQLVNVLELFERIGVAHLDIKPPNMVWNGETLKIIDFGTVIIFYNEPTLISQWLKEKGKLVGFTSSYAPPEIVNRTIRVSDVIPIKCDVYSFGITLCQILSYYKGFEVPNEKTEDRAIQIRDILEEAKLEKWIEVVLSCIDDDPEQRPSFEELKRKIKIVLRNKIPEADVQENSDLQVRLQKVDQCLRAGQEKAAFWRLNQFVAEEKPNIETYCRYLNRISTYYQFGLMSEDDSMKFKGKMLDERNPFYAY